MAVPFISVVIPTCQREDMLRLCMERLTPGVQTLDKSVYEVIVSDDGKENTAEQLVKVSFPWARWINGPGRGPAANRNNGAKHAQGEWLVFLDDDVLPDGLLLDEYKKAIGKHPEVLAFEGAILPDDWELLKKDMAECPVNTTGGCFWSANICVNKSLFDSVNGFDEQFGLAAQEDQDLYERIKKTHQVHFVAACKVTHPVRIVSLLSKILKVRPGIVNWFNYVGKENSFLKCFRIGLSSQLKALCHNAKSLKLKSTLYTLYILVLYMPIMVLLNSKRIRSRRKFQWYSSVDEGNDGKLQKLQAEMSVFYSGLKTRNEYNKMISNPAEDGTLDDVTKGFLEWFSKYEFKSILEVGCGTGRIRALLPLKDDKAYTGIEISSETISQNISRWPMSAWECKGVYDLDNAPDNSYDLVFSFYVLEHLVYPRKALEIMYDKTAVGGFMVIICPDFCETRRFPSQFLGLSSLLSARLRLRKFRILDAIISLYDSRIRLRSALKNIRQNPGTFKVNVNPVCLVLREYESIWPDCDATYLSNKGEIEKWALEKKMEVYYPRGKDGIFKEHIFIILKKINTRIMLLCLFGSGMFF